MIVRHVSIFTAIRTIIGWGIKEVAPIVDGCCGFACYDNNIITRIVIIKYEPGDMARLVLCIERNPTSSIQSFIAEMYTMVKSKIIYTICSPSNPVLNDLKTALQWTESKMMTGDVKLVHSR